MLTNHVVSLDLAKELKELGVKQESLFWWRSPLPHHGWKDWSLGEGELGHGTESFSAFLASELGEMLPSEYRSRKNLQTSGYTCEKANETSVRADAATEADARAKMLIHLIKQGIVKV